LVSQTWNHNKETSLIILPLLRMYRIDIISAIFLGSRPRFELELDNPAADPNLEDLERCNPICTRYQTKLSNLTGLQDLSHETIKVYRILRHLIMEKERVAGLQNIRTTYTALEWLQLHLYSFQVMYRLTAIVRYKIPDSPNQNALIYALFGLAGVAHILMFTCNAHLRLGDPISLSTRIRTGLEKINTQAFQIAYPEMTLWIVMIGGMASLGTEHIKWFIELLVELCRAAGIATTAELALTLNEFLWSDFYLTCPLFYGFWDDLRKGISECG
jgi:hypothetical protein